MLSRTVPSLASLCMHACITLHNQSHFNSTLLSMIIHPDKWNTLYRHLSSAPTPNSNSVHRKAHAWILYPTPLEEEGHYLEQGVQHTTCLLPPHDLKISQVGMAPVWDKERVFFFFFFFAFFRLCHSIYFLFPSSIPVLEIFFFFLSLIPNWLQDLQTNKQTLKKYYNNLKIKPNQSIFIK